MFKVSQVTAQKQIEIPALSFEEAEAVVLSTILAFPDHIHSYMAINELKMRDFHKPAHKEIFSAILAVRNMSRLPDGVMVGKYLHETGSDITGVIYELPSPTPENLRHYIDELKRYTTRRETREFSLNLLENIHDLGTSADEVLTQALVSLTTIASGVVDQEIIPIRDSIKTTYTQLMEAQETGGAIITSTGFPALDTLFGGFIPGEYIIVAARPGMGKTAMALDMALEVAKTKPVYICSLEMTVKELNQRIISKFANISLQRLRGGYYSQAEADAITKAVGTMEDLNLYEFESLGMSPSQIYLSVKKHMTLHKIQPALVIVDYLGLVAPENKYNVREREVAEMSRSFKLYAQELNCCFLVVCQLNRESERREDREPRLADLRESGAIEQDANVVLGLSRKAYYRTSIAPENEAVCLVLKNRSGPCKDVKLIWNPKTATFKPLAITETDTKKVLPKRSMTGSDS